MHEILHSEYEPRNNEIGNASPPTSLSSTSESLSNRQSIQNENKSKEDFQCKICPYKGYDRKSIRVHNEKHTYRDGAFKCRYCLFYSYTKNSLLDHERLHAEFTSENVNHNGGYIKKEHAIDLEENKGEKTNEKSKLYGCSMCPFKSPDSEKLEIHTRRHDSKNFPQNSLKCGICSYRSMSSTALKKHQYIHFKLQPSVMVKQESYPLNGSPIYLSTLKEYSNQSNSGVHVSEQSNVISSPLCNNTQIIDNSIQTSTNINEKTNLDSTDIVNGNESSSNSTKNRQQSNGRLSSSCPHCPYRPTSANCLQRHMKRHIVKENCKRCKYCPYYSSNLKNMKRHEHKHEIYLNRQENPKLKRSKCEMNSRINDDVVETFNIEKNESIQIIKECLNELIESIVNESKNSQ